MKINNKTITPLAIIVFLVLFFWILWGVQNVPVANTEFEWFRYSSDLEKTIKNPLAISDSPFTAESYDYQNRLNHPPLPKYIFGLVRLLNGFSTEELLAITPGSNQASQLIFQGRILNAALLSFSILMVYLITQKFAGSLAGIIAMVFLGTQSILLIFLRQVSADGLIIFLLTLFLYAIINWSRKPILHGIILALLCSTQVYWIFLTPLSVVSLFWQKQDKHNNLSDSVSRLMSFLLTFAICFLILNPLYWKHPALIIPAVFDQAIPDSPEAALLSDTSVLKKIGDSVLAIFIDDPKIESFSTDAGLSSGGQIYLSNPAHLLFRGLLGGSLVFLLSILGLGLMLVSDFSRDQRSRILILAGSALILLVSFIANPLADQHLYLPVFVIISIWLGTGIGYPLIEKEPAP